MSGPSAIGFTAALLPSCDPFACFGNTGRPWFGGLCFLRECDSWYLLMRVPVNHWHPRCWEDSMSVVLKACCEWRGLSTRRPARARLQSHTCHIVRSVRDDSVSPANCQIRGKTEASHPGSQMVSLHCDRS